jgi:hypothetical protein
MALLIDLRRDGSLWRCDGCEVETVLGDGRRTGWAADGYPGGPHHWCPECLVVHNIHVGTPAEWEAAWEGLHTASPPADGGECPF